MSVGSPRAVSSVRTTSSQGRFSLRQRSIQAWYRYAPLPCRAVLIWSRSPSLIRQKQTNSGLASSRSISLTRLSGSCVGEEAADLVGRRLLAGQVERDPAEERGVAGRRARGHLERLEPLEQLVVDEVAPLELGEVEGQVGIDDRRQPRADDVRLVADDQVGLGPAQERDLALRGHRGGRVVIELNEASRVTSRWWPSA